MGALDGKVAMVTGAARGQGRSHAIALAKQGAHVVALDIAAQIATAPYPLATPEDLQHTRRLIENEGGRCLTLRADVRQQAELDACVATAVAEFGTVDILVINHGMWSLGMFWELTEEQWSDTLDVCLSGVWRVAKAVAPLMIEQRSGVIVSIGSTAATQPTTNYAHYATAKAGVVHLARVFALELGRYGVRSNSISPGIVDTDIVNFQGVYDRVRPGATREDFLRSVHHGTALARRSVLPSASVTNTLMWLVSDAAADITGVDIPVDAGAHVLPRYNHDPVVS